MNLALTWPPRRTVVFSPLITLAPGILLGPAASGGGRLPAVEHAAAPVVSTLSAAPAAKASPRMSSSAPMSPAGSLPDFTEVARAVAPSVVTVRSRREAERSSVLFDFVHPFEEPDEVWPERRLQRGPASGVVADARGNTRANNHVVKGCTKAGVVLSSGRHVTAEIRGVDPRSGPVVMEVPNENLQSIEMGRLAGPETGARVLAVGGRFAESLAHSAPAGIGSDKGRSNPRPAGIEDFIQTDADINPGNSGGAPVNTRGRPVATNAAITTGKDGFQGAAPRSLSTGRARFWELSLCHHRQCGGGRAGPQGGSASGRRGAGIQPTGLEEVLRAAQPQRGDASGHPRVRPGIGRNREGLEISATLRKNPTEETRAAGGAQGGEGGLGLGVRGLAPAEAEQPGMRGEYGAVVQEVDSGPAADEAGLQPGDVITVELTAPRL